MSNRYWSERLCCLGSSLVVLFLRRLYVSWKSLFESFVIGFIDTEIERSSRWLFCSRLGYLRPLLYVNQMTQVERQCCLCDCRIVIGDIKGYPFERFEYPVAVNQSVGRQGPDSNIKMTSFQYRKSHYGDKTVVKSSYLCSGISYTGKTTSLYRIRAQSFQRTLKVIFLPQLFFHIIKIEENDHIFNVLNDAFVI